MDNTELAGRIEALTKCVLHLVAELEDRSLIDGPAFSGQIRDCIRPREDSPDHLRVARQRLRELADVLDGARQARLDRARPVDQI